MGRLIDVDVLIAKMNEYHYDICNPDMRRAEHIVKTHLAELIDKQPTAYDPDKVAEQLKEEKEFSYADFDEYVNEVCPCLDAEYDDFFHKGLERAIDIVKAGGVDE